MKRVLILALLCVVTALPARAQQQLTPAAFFGTWTGGGVAENRDSLYFNMTARDLDVIIRPVDNGFTVSWSTLIRQGGNVQQPNQRKRETVRTFRPAPTGRIWRCTESGDPLNNQEACWARISGKTLTIYQMTVLASGAYEIEQYDRTLLDTGMDLKFTRLRDREPVRTVTGKLIKSGP
jgi:hypothetical protein